MNIWFAYLKEVFSQYKYLLGGGSVLVLVGSVVEHFLGLSLTWSMYVWILAGCLVTAMMSQGVKQYRRLQTRIIVCNLQCRVWPLEQHGFTGIEYYFEVRNTGEAASLEGVRVELVRMIPDEIKYLPVPLHIKHDPYESRECSINPGATRQFDLITGPITHPSSQKVMIVAHTVNSERVPIPLGRYTLTVRVSAKNSPPTIAVFQAWICEGELKCICL